MKKMLLYVAMLLIASVAVGQEVDKTTFHYATHQGQELLLDRYSVECGDEARPCMIFAFGGGFVGGQRDHEYYSIYFDRLAKAGIVVVSIDYRLGLKDLPSDIGIVGMIGIPSSQMGNLAGTFRTLVPLHLNLKLVRP